MVSTFLSNTILLLVLIAGGLSASVQTNDHVKILAKNGGVILSPLNATNITYLISAPVDKKIELIIDFYNFLPCRLQDVKFINANDNRACVNNHHMIITNKQGALDKEFFSIMTKKSSQWIFCDSNRPFKKFLSLTNAIELTNVYNGIQLSSEMKTPAYRIRYRVLDSVFKQDGSIRIVQDLWQLSPVAGYLHSVKVPANHHLRFYGKSNKCQMPTYTVLSKNSTNPLFKRNNQVLTLNKSQFKAENCSYLFDVSEPQMLKKNDWYAEWFLQYDTAFDLYDFELGWSFIPNQILDKKKPSSVALPFQYGFNISQELEFEFITTHAKRKYSLIFQAKHKEISSDLKDKSYIRSKVYGLQELVIPLMSKSFTKSQHPLNGFNGTLFIKRNSEWSMTIDYDLESNSGDCDFDSSFCGYSNIVDSDMMVHLPKYESFNSYSKSTDEIDFYLGVRHSTKLNNLTENATIYSPLIRIQDTEKIDSMQGSINKKLMSLSFSYMYDSNTSDKLSVRIKSERSDVKATLVDSTVVETVGATEFPMAKTIDSLNECVTDSLEIWKRVERMPVFSCVDFRLAFVFENGMASDGHDHFMGLDDVEINYEDEVLSKCNEMEKCSNNGECYNFNGEETCCCFPGFSGNDCSIQTNPCDFITCQNNGTCARLSGFDYECQCAAGYTGQHCDAEIDECEVNPCGVNGKCYDRIGSYECACEPGYSGKNCDEVSEYCKQKCSNDGTLRCFEDGLTNVKCQCKPGYTGEVCDVNINECMSSPCFGDTVCIDKINDFECACDEGRTGKFCQIKLDHCQENGHLCHGDSVCLESNSDGSSIKCACPYGFFGKFCNETIEITNCEPNSCNGGTCIEQEIGYKCDCPKGFSGNRCETKPDNRCFGNKCQNGHCLTFDGQDDYICKCFDNYAGEFCEIEECNNENLEQFCERNNTVDTVKDRSFYDKLVCKCLCKNGYIGERCQIKIDLCESIENAVEMLESHGQISYGKHCSNGGTCHYNTTTDQVECLCAPGYTGERCQMKEMNSCQGNPCMYGTCNELEGAYECSCTSGWEGKNCDVKKVCDINAECVVNNTMSVTFSYSDDRCICKCKHGFEGKDCSVDHDDCANLKPEHMCQNDGLCIDRIGSYDCECPQGFGGFFCETKLKGCAMNPCKYGKCEEENFEAFTCKCHPGYTGDLCDKSENLCEPSPCENNAKCHQFISDKDSKKNDFFCECPPEFGTSSKTCSHRTVDPCIVSPCLNNATCASSSDYLNTPEGKILAYSHFTCKCPKEYTGDLCEERITSCSTKPCQNKGQCIPGKADNTFTCRCFPAFTGKFCEHLLDQCHNFPCNNGAKCMSTPKGYKCQCPINYTGKDCDTLIKPCDTMKCLNDGECVVNEKDVPYCDCGNKRYTGTQCEIDLTQLINNTMIVKTSAIRESEEDIPCGVLGNNVSMIDYIFFFLIVAFILIVIVGVLYIYVQLNIKRVKAYLKKVNFDNEVTTEISQVTRSHH